MNKYFFIALVVILVALSASTYYFFERTQILKAENERLNVNQKDLARIYDSLAQSYVKLLDKKNYSISLNPTIETKVNSVLGSSKQLTFQYYFTMDGNNIKLEPDSTLILKK